MDNVSKYDIQKWDWSILGQTEDVNPYAKYVKEISRQNTGRRAGDISPFKGLLTGETRI